MADSRKTGELIETSYFDNIGGLNISDSPFKVLDSQATGGGNFEYTMTGGIQKRRGAQAINSVANASLKSRGIDVFTTTLGVKTVMRAADTKLQAVDIDNLTFTNLSQDTTTVNTTIFPVATSITTAFASYNTDTVSLLNLAGGTDGVYSAYSTTKFTKNGAVAPAGTVAFSSTLSTGGAWTTSGNFYYAVSYTKTATGAESNATLDFLVAVTTTTQSNVITFSALTSVDTATYSSLKLYRSTVNGSNLFTTGNLVATLTLPVVSYTDTGTQALTSQNIPRVGSVILDKSPLPTGTYNVLTLWKRRLVTATGNVLRYSDLNIPEAWPTVNTITIPSGGPITALAVISFNTDYGNDEYLAVFKERELWLVKGNSYNDVTLSFVDTVGCATQSLIALANGFLTWVDYRGIYIWDGSGKPIYTSQPIETLFTIDGDIDKPLLQYGCASYFRNRNMIYWFLSSKIYGTQKLCIKMDLRLTMPNVSANGGGRVLPGVFVTDSNAQAVYAAKTYLPATSADEKMVLGDGAGFIYNGYQVFSDAGTGIDFQYYTPFLDMGSPNSAKRFKSVIVWLEDVGTWDISLDYWSGYRAALSTKSTLVAPVSATSQNDTALWDVAYWDVAYWDDYTQKLTGVVFNLNNVGGNSEGDCIRLRLRNSGVDQPVTVFGYSVIWQEKGLKA